MLRMETLTEQALRQAAVCPAELSGAAGPPDDIERWVGRHLVDASDPAELDAAIETIAADVGFWALVRAARVRLVVAPTETQLITLWSRIGATVGAEPGFSRGVEEFGFLVHALSTLHRIHPPQADDLEREPLWFAYDPAIPPTVGRSVLRGVYASVAFRGIAFAARVGATTHPWWRSAIVARWIADQHAYLRLVASLPGIETPVEIVPPTERYDLLSLMRDNASASDAVSALVAEGERSEKLPWGPFAHEGHEPR